MRAFDLLKRDAQDLRRCDVTSTMPTSGLAAREGFSSSSRANQANSSYNSDQEEQDVEYPEPDNESRFNLVPTSIQTDRCSPGTHAEVDSDWATNDTGKQHSDETYPESIPDSLDDLLR